MMKNSPGDTLSLKYGRIHGEIIHLLRKCFLRTYYVPRSVLRPWGRVVNQPTPNLCPYEVYFLVEDMRDLMRNQGLTITYSISSGGGNGSPLQYSCLENPMDRGAWRDTIHGVAENRTQLKRLSTHVQYIITDVTLDGAVHQRGHI